MKYSFSVQGGFAGLNLQVQGTHEDLPAELLPVLQKMSNSPSVFQVQMDSNTQPDEGIYKLHLENEGKIADFRFGDLHPAPDEIKPLIKFLKKKAQQQL
ncbi:MAG: hypothetical protein JWO06_99 [Bacteroidota bacterium]|nr:hypothetical protein [Bacteroidota bacterium]